MRSLLRGLRARLVVAFLLVAAVSSLTTAALTYREARNAILQRSQDTAINDLRSQIDSLAPDLPVPPNREDLEEFARQLDRAGNVRSWTVYVSYKGLPTAPAGMPGIDGIVGSELREKVSEHHIPAFQRVTRDDSPWLIIGMPVSYADTGATEAAELPDRAASGLEVYAEVPLRAEESNVEALVSAAQRGALPALALSVVPALIAARGVLRPVRKLRRAAGQIAAGRMDTRLKVSGSDELADLSRSFNDMAATLEENVAELRRMEANSRRFAADVSHELRTPLAAMAAVTDVLDEDADGLDPDTASAVRLISQETGKLARMVEDLMEVSRFDAGAAALHLDEVDVSEAVRKSLQARGWQEQVTAELPAGVRARLDPRRLDVIVANLVGNALRHGGAPVAVRLRTEDGPTAAEAPKGAGLLIEVADNGPGIAPEALPHVFDRFYKADAARGRSEGSGLGLAITMENARLHGGTVHAANGPSGGAVFTVELPIRTHEELSDELDGVQGGEPGDGQGDEQGGQRSEVPGSAEPAGATAAGLPAAEPAPGPPERAVPKTTPKSMRKDRA
ncbi:ATP-binding protein [Streptomyces sp. H27-D2]|uniref:ATP-binding protein n=1 Tax=Streptomyces sp. H27-D2 TaxID=3046304 RepID=UPI002DC06069|nr:ATP-binding protein [Streptomyces sp. H27-D2]MEC4017509.1 ATP-binding protein [Streptomyces sp. H27-D2]